MATLATYEYVQSRLITLKYGLYDAEAAIRTYRNGVGQAIEGPVTQTLEGEADGWIGRLDSAQWAVDVYWEGYVADKIAELEAATEPE
jgi:hypothetical protein